MRYLAVLFFAMALVSCGVQDKDAVLTGRFVVTKTFVAYDFAGDCSGITSHYTAGQKRDEIWIIDKTDGGYTLTQEDSDGNQLITGMSNNGHHFSMSGPVMGIFTLTITRDLEYVDDTLGGKEVNKLSYNGEYCAEHWDVLGVLE